LNLPQHLAAGERIRSSDSYLRLGLNRRRRPLDGEITISSKWPKEFTKPPKYGKNLVLAGEECGKQEFACEQ
jgi:hypothetical protein